MTTPARPAAAAATALAAVALALVGCASSEPSGGGGEDSTLAGAGWEEQSAEIDGLINYQSDRPEILGRGHTEERVDYPVLPPVGGPHHPAWLNCNGEVYDQPVPVENAVHSLEHGAVWVTYRPELAAGQVAALAERVRGDEKLFMSPFPDLPAPISLQAWGFQLAVEDASDERFDQFIRVLRINAAPEPMATCEGGV